jgi:hypothetical protein
MVNFLVLVPAEQKFQHVTQNLSQKLASEGNVDPSNAARVLYIFHVGQMKDITMCYSHLLVAHLARHGQLSGAGAN